MYIFDIKMFSKKLNQVSLYFYKILLRALIFFLVYVFLMCKSIAENSPANLTVLGDRTSHIVWIYLCGLTETINSPQEMHNRKILDAIGRELNLTVIAVPPSERCFEFSNKLCWLQDTYKQRQATLAYIHQKIHPNRVSGFIGFSNGGFFLNQLAQEQSLNVPIISIGSAGPYIPDPVQNELYLIIGRHDRYHYHHAIRFYQAMTNTQLNVHLIEINSDHEIVKAPLKNLLHSLISKKSKDDESINC